jgi:tRNA pseudouridine55 synthase
MTDPAPKPTPRASAGSPALVGLLLIDKPAGWTSMDVCARVRARLRKGGAPKRVKVGHAGTLDPMATGLLVVLVGRATRRCDEFMASRKTYEATIDLSRRSTTDDATGACTPVDVATPPSEDHLRDALRAFVGTIMQRPPAFSALHVGGRRAYDLARAGSPPDLPARPVVVHAVDLLEYAWPLARVRVECGKGTYIRSIARDLGAALATGGLLASLRRTASGAFDVREALALDALPPTLTQADLRSA